VVARNTKQFHWDAQIYIHLTQDVMKGRARLRHQQGEVVASERGKTWFTPQGGPQQQSRPENHCGQWSKTNGKTAVQSLQLLSTSQAETVASQTRRSN